MEENKGKKKSVLREYAEAFLIALVLAFVIRLFVVEAFKIPSGSMIPTLLVGDHLLVNKFIYKFTEPKRHEIVVFKYPDDPSRNFIKRIIAVGGDRVEIRNKNVYVNGLLQTEPYVQHVFQEILPAHSSPRDNLGPITIPANTFFMLGDNRDSSLDSRFWEHQFVTRQALVGKAMIIYWSWKTDEAPAEQQRETFGQKVLRTGKTIVYYLTHFPSVVRWNRLARLVK